MLVVKLLPTTTSAWLWKPCHPSYQYDAAGNTTAIDSMTFNYNAANRLAGVDQAGQITQAIYNAQGQRAKKIAPNGDSTHYIYDTNGQLIAEADANGQIQREYLYLHGEPLALMENDQIYYYFNDHLGTPQILIDINQQTVWQADYDAFGKAQITVNTVENNLRFAGQYYDEETGLHYNYFRYYDPSTGRYITSDPIGLTGGLNTYLYANANPLRYTDPNGLCPMCLVIPGVCAGGGCEALGLGAIGAWWAAHNSSNDDNVIPGPWPDSTSSDDASDNPEQCPNDDQKKKEKNCRALYNATLQSCASITNRRAQQRCHEAAKANYEACMSQD